MAFSAGLTLSDLNDYISPSQACIKPVEVKKKSDQSSAITVDNRTGDYYEVALDGTETKLETASITLNDCLACSGCITSAESVLIAMQSHQEVWNVLQANQTAKSQGQWDQVKHIVVSVSPQTYASFAAKYGLGIEQTAQRITAALKQLGVDHVFDTSFARDLSLLKIGQEFVDRFQTKQSSGGASSNDNPLPMLASACPGWVCYAEKTHGSLLPHISHTRSPQQMMGALVKDYFYRRHLSPEQSGTSIPWTPERIYHVCIMPCYDKKLEASREDFQLADDPQTKEVDCVISTSELEVLFSQCQISFPQLPEAPLDTLFTKIEADPTPGEQGARLARAAGTSSGGYLEYVMAYAAHRLFGLDSVVPGTVEGASSPLIRVKTVRNADFREVTLVLPDGSVGLRFAAVYGFRNIQTLVRKIKLGRCPYQFVEIMACPSGCINGGGQIRALTEPIPDTVGPMSPKEWVNLCEATYKSLPVQDPTANSPLASIIQDWFGDQGLASEQARSRLETQYRAVTDTPTTSAVVEGW
ncbi:Cytosolic Fe-S cluster assembly factor nar1 [Dispira parvispora]|uniref:Cytosolic Fe-S cluster assembly factor nar1 n=1 Tax=Dispira parvispora TaxID=1520584 RepID=A0A9W8AUA6_9FUNG|nr:Cytosolic Fe-S cluster assembly factor nar1 [Dispira parvispora]